MLVAAATLAGSLTLAPGSVSAEGLFDFFFGGGRNSSAADPPNFFSDPFGINQPAIRARTGAARRRIRACVLRAQLRRQIFSADHARNASPVQTCQAFCPASVTKVFYGSNIDGATASNGERYADSENAFAYRKALRADCTCNGRSPSGLAPVDLTLDTSLRSGDVDCHHDGLVAYTGVRLGADQTAEFTPVASFPGLTADVRARLGEMKVAPVTAEMAGESAAAGGTGRTSNCRVLGAEDAAPKAKRAEAN